ncbi:hypothetical protein [uncultured Fibrella sp.]|uniref:hypothetical protein n=1 Tax=uncultured Fibrella sp. TaxID=1284596 RepID=UPI0035CAB0E4
MSSLSSYKQVRFFSLFLFGLTLATPALPQAPAPHEYPRTVLYQGILHPIVTFSQDAPVVNFKTFYQVGFPVGVNIWKTAKIGYSLEIVPFIRSEAGVSRMNNVLFHPGVLVGLGNGFTLANRLAFETGGRYGVTPVLNKTFRRPGPVNYFLAVPLPVRFGNDRPTSVTLGFQFGLAF